MASVYRQNSDKSSEDVVFMIPKVAAALAKFIKPISTESQNSMGEGTTTSGDKKQKGNPQKQSQKQPEQQHEEPKLKVIQGGATEVTPKETQKPQKSNVQSLVFDVGQKIKGFVNKVLAQDAYEESNGSAKGDDKGKKGGLVDKKII